MLVKMVYKFSAKGNLTPVELDEGDTVEFTLKNGETRVMTLVTSRAWEVETTSRVTPVARMECDVIVDGHPVTFRRYVGTQDSFYEPFSVNGMTVWFDMSIKLFNVYPERYGMNGNERARPYKEARFSLQDSSLGVCEEKMHRWMDFEGDTVNIDQCYHGGDCWMGSFWGQGHRGLDINMPRGNSLYVPFDVDDQYLFNSVAAGDNNNRWIATRTWADGTVWAIQTHHLISLKNPEHIPLKRGTDYAAAAGVWTWDFDHTHFEFKITHRDASGNIPNVLQKVNIPDGEAKGDKMPVEGQPPVFHLDPWILIREMMDDIREAAGKTVAKMQGVGPATTGNKIVFRSTGPIAKTGKEPSILWDFGDGLSTHGESVGHVYSAPGAYAVKLTVNDGQEKKSCIQIITVDGEPCTAPENNGRPSAFDPWPVGVTLTR